MVITEDIQQAIGKVPAAAWAPAYDGDGEAGEGAWVADITGLLDLGSWPAGMRVIVRKERPHPGAQLRFTDIGGHRFTAFATDAKKGQLADLELRHRRRARCEDRIRGAKDTGLRNLPLKDFARNQIWCEIAALPDAELRRFLAYLTRRNTAAIELPIAELRTPCATRSQLALGWLRRWQAILNCTICVPPPAPDSEQIDPPVVAAKTPPGELDLALSQVREAVLLADLVGRSVRDRGKGVDMPELPLPPRPLQNLPHGLAGNPPVLELGQDHPPDLIDRLIVMRRLKDIDPAGRGRSLVRDYLERPAPSPGGQSQRLRVRTLDGFPRPGATQPGHHLRVGLQPYPELEILLGHHLQLHQGHVNADG
jgi:hypothetical protein